MVESPSSITPQVPEASPTPQPTPQKPDNLWLLLAFVFTAIFLSTTALLIYQNFQLQKQIASLQLTPPPIPTTTPDPTSNWKTYTNSRFNYSFKYPDNWSLNSDSPGIVEVASVPSSQYLHGGGKPPRGSAWFGVASVPTLEADGQSETEVGSGITITLITTYKQKGGETFKLEGGYWKDDPKPEEKKRILDQIFSTFTFTGEGGEGQFCGGFTGAICPEGYSCKYDGNYPDASGVCVKGSISP